MEFERLRRDEFSACTENGVYLNHAGISPTPARVALAVTEALRLSASDPLAYFGHGLFSKMASARHKLAALMGVPASDLAFTKNTGHALSIVADGLDLNPGDNVVMADCEYPAVTYPWMAQAWRGIETRLVRSRPDGTIALEDVEAAMDDRTRALAVSWVQFGTGFRVDLARWAALAHSRGALIIADVIQGLGVLPLDSAKIGLDIVATGSHKWLMAPTGLGALYIAPPVLDRIRLVNMGAASVANVLAFDPLVFDPKPTAQRYEEGTPNGLALCGLDASLGLIEEAGLENIARHVLDLTWHAANELTENGYDVMSPRDDDARAGIVMFQHPTHSNEMVLKALEEKHVSAAIRGGLLRFSPHFYNTFEEIDIAIAALPK